ncbi:hypothetical protein M5D96_001765 [Drosophila gunungcola]|uniref:Uncharacterized protein n=1 Tax=Drosophila gunungcola TaxID=103775 RepID=A0A9P9YZ84_9MUSC|nr:hypothetical protein M5D96_001765 [Drosophila gunungcola]
MATIAKASATFLGQSFGQARGLLPPVGSVAHPHHIALLVATLPRGLLLVTITIARVFLALVTLVLVMLAGIHNRTVAYVRLKLH